MQRLLPTVGARYAGPKDPAFFLSTYRLGTFGGVPSKGPLRFNVWVARACGVLATNLAGVARKLYRGKKKTDQVEIEAGPWHDLFEKPNPLLKKDELFVTTVLQMCGMGGSSYWILEGDGDEALGPTEVPSEIWPVVKSAVEPVRSQNGRGIVAYKVRNLDPDAVRKGQPEVVVYPAHQVIHHRFVDPADPTGSMDPLEAAANGIRAEWMAAQWNEAFFKNDATPGIILSADKPLTPDQIEANKKEWHDIHSGYSKAHRVAVLQGGMKAQVIGATHTTMGFGEQREWNREEVFAALGVPPWYAGVSQDMNYATAKSAERIMWEGTLLPLSRIIANNLGEDLFAARDPALERQHFLRAFPAVGAADVWLEFDTSTVEALRGDQTEKIANAKGYRDLGYTMNEINAKLGLGMDEMPPELGDARLVPAGLILMDDVVEGVDLSSLLGGGGGEEAPPKDEPTGDEAEEPDESADKVDDPYATAMLPQHLRGKAARAAFTAGEKRRAAIWHQVNARVLVPGTRDMTKAVKLVVAKIAQDVLPRLRAAAGIAAIDVLFSQTEVYVDLMRRLGRPILTQAAEGGLIHLSAALGGSGPRVDHPAIAAQLRAQTFALKDIPEAITQVLRESLAAGVELGEDNTLLSARAEKVLKVSNNVARLVARDEVQTAVNTTRHEAMKVEGIAGREWITSRDERVRESHVSLDGVVVALEERYPKTYSGSRPGPRYPRDPELPPDQRKGCRCIEGPVLEF